MRSSTAACASELYNYFRDYDPAIGRYIQSDPIGLDGGLSTYGYVGGSPLSRLDPYGLASKPPICFGKDCPDPPFCPTPDGPRPCPQPEKPGKGKTKEYSCDEVSPSLGACLLCCASRSPGQYLKKPGSTCQQRCNDAWGITKRNGDTNYCEAR